jgi:four helix bundle protein
MASIDSHEDLVAWQLSEKLKDGIFEFTKRQAVAKDRGFCDDIRRSGRSAPANLSEGFYRFRPRDNARFVRIAIGSLGETLNHLGHARKEAYLTQPEFEELWNLAKRAKNASTGWLTYLDSCPPDGPARKPRSLKSSDPESPNNPERPSDPPSDLKPAPEE